VIEHKSNKRSSHSSGDTRCHDLLDNLSEFIDGTLREELCKQIQHHMEGCENCRIVVDTLRKTVDLYQETSAHPPALPEGVRERLYHSLALDDFLKKI